MTNYVRASGAMPGFFAPYVEGNSTFADGATLLTVDLATTIERCYEKVGNYSDIILDVIMVQEGKDARLDICSQGLIQRMQEHERHTDAL